MLVAGLMVDPRTRPGPGRGALREAPSSPPPSRGSGAGSGLVDYSGGEAGAGTGVVRGGGVVGGCQRPALRPAQLLAAVLVRTRVEEDRLALEVAGVGLGYRDVTAPGHVDDAGPDGDVREPGQG